MSEFWVTAVLTSIFWDLGMCWLVWTVWKDGARARAEAAELAGMVENARAEACQLADMLISKHEEAADADEEGLGLFGKAVGLQVDYEAAQAELAACREALSVVHLKADTFERWCGECVDERDEARTARDDAGAEIAALKVALDTAEALRALALHDRDMAEAELDVAHSAVVMATDERDAARDERDALAAKLEAAETGNRLLSEQCAETMREFNEVLDDFARMQRQRDAAFADRDAERDDLMRLRRQRDEFADDARKWQGIAQGKPKARKSKAA